MTNRIRSVEAGDKPSDLILVSYGFFDSEDGKNRFVENVSQLSSQKIVVLFITPVLAPQLLLNLQKVKKK
jgi:hypothetical protein